jgi:predicted SnoaL-like aldol condensation-catalyzing enzyme
VGVSVLFRMPRHAAKLFSAVVQGASPKKLKAKSRRIVRRMAQGTLLAMTIATTRFDGEEPGEKKRLFSAGLLDRLRAPITRYHE